MRSRRAAVVLRYWEDRPESEVAQILGCAVGTVRSQTFRGLARLRRDPQLTESVPGTDGFPLDFGHGGAAMAYDGTALREAFMAEIEAARLTPPTADAAIRGSRRRRWRGLTFGAGTVAGKPWKFRAWT
ncbi:hypothetical protein B4N89_14420 [Embleya scabrispora]|uniref:RNA polymerase sigma factor 70 region 4 type 2 domain-containing protein n=1 Tax=Embleya scabrispora TaxID=159449 RepID=A0A1T3NZ32_9ACTN|nr:hypothetical protein B4N89_14420 [Embleya scabrispora]